MASEIARSVSAQANAHRVVPNRYLSTLLGPIGKLPPWCNAVAYRRGGQLLIDGSVVATALGAAYMIRFDGAPPTPYYRQFLLVVPFFVSLYLGANLVT